MSRIFVDRISPYQSGSVQVDGLNIDTGSLTTTASFNDYTSSTDSRLNSIENETGSLLETASVNLNTITFTKSDSSTFDITVDTGSAGGGGTIDTGSFATTGSNTFTGKQFLVGTDQGIEIGSDAERAQFANLQLKVSETDFTESFYNTIVINNDGKYTGFEVQRFDGQMKHDLYFDGEQVIQYSADNDNVTQTKPTFFDNNLTLLANDPKINLGEANFDGSEFTPVQYPNIGLWTSEVEFPDYIYMSVLLQNVDNQHSTGFVVAGPSGSVNKQILVDGDIIFEKDFNGNYKFDMGTPIMQYSSSADFYIYPNSNFEGELDVTGKINGKGDLEIIGTTLVGEFTSSNASFTNTVSIGETMNLAASDPLPSGNVGDLAVSGSELFFYNGAWTQIS